jgi:hypothetical protein
MHLSHLIPINTEFFIWDAVVAWRDHILNNNFYKCSKGSYFTSMLKLIESQIIDVHLELNKVDKSWLNECKNKIDRKSVWAKSTKTVRKSCLNSFYNFIINIFDKSLIPYQRYPKSNEIEFLFSTNVKEKEKHEALEKAVLKHVLSNVAEKVKARDICPIVLCNALSKINERDAYIVWLMMHTGQLLEKILDLRKENLRFNYMDNKKLAYGGYLDFDICSSYIPGHIIDGINEVCKNSMVYLFETAASKRITRAQVNRNLKQAGRNIGLDFDLTPKILHGYVCAYMSTDKRSELEKALCFSIN